MVVSDGTGGLISMVNYFFHGPVGFTFVFSCAVVGISSGRLCQFSVHLELDLLDA